METLTAVQTEKQDNLRTAVQSLGNCVKQNGMEKILECFFFYSTVADNHEEANGKLWMTYKMLIQLDQHLKAKNYEKADATLTDFIKEWRYHSIAQAFVYFLRYDDAPEGYSFLLWWIINEITEAVKAMEGE